MIDDSYKHEITCIVPVTGQPKRTKRLVDNILLQTVNDFELYLFGAANAEFEELIQNEEFNSAFQKAAQNGADIYTGNLPYLDEEKSDNEIFNFCIPDLTGKYTVFCYPTDIIKENHFENYLSEIKETNLDLVFFDLDFDTPKAQGVKKAELSEGNISLKNVIINTQTLKKVINLKNISEDTKKNPWLFLQSFLEYKHRRSDKAPSYTVKHTEHHGTFDELD